VSCCCCRCCYIYISTQLTTSRNAPYVFGIRSAACALAAGNTTILKSSELTPRCYWAIGRAFEDAGLPAGCLNIIHCRPTDAADVVNAMIEHPAVRKINFTGSTAVGRKIARSCGQNLKPCLMELGGKNSSIVCQDADLDTAVQGVLAGAFLNVCPLPPAPSALLSRQGVP
jgi:acyl-CoA reductase-like NAD-dependent aldehyde dehydrogenase